MDIKRTYQHRRDHFHNHQKDGQKHHYDHHDPLQHHHLRCLPHPRHLPQPLPWPCQVDQHQQATNIPLKHLLYSFVSVVIKAAILIFFDVTQIGKDHYQQSHCKPVINHDNNP